jgi:hypothetical protein
MKFGSIDRLKIVLSMEKIEPTQLQVQNVEPEIAYQPRTPYDESYTTEWKLCGFTLGEIIKANICGEAKGEMRKNPDAANLVYATMMNRRLHGPAHLLSDVNRGPIYNGDMTHPMARVIFSRWQYSVWNDRSIFDNCENFKNKMNELMSGCLLNGPPCHVCGINALRDLGFTDQEAAKTTHYINPRTADSKENWVIDVIESWRNHPTECKNGTPWTDQIRNDAGQLGTVRMVCVGKHVFISGLP